MINEAIAVYFEDEDRPEADVVVVVREGIPQMRSGFPTLASSREYDHTHVGWEASALWRGRPIRLNSPGIDHAAFFGSGRAVVMQTTDRSKIRARVARLVRAYIDLNEGVGSVGTPALRAFCVGGYIDWRRFAARY